MVTSNVPVIVVIPSKLQSQQGSFKIDTEKKILMARRRSVGTPCLSLTLKIVRK